MFSALTKKIQVLKNLNWSWAWRYYRKHFKIHFFYFLAKIQGKKYLTVTVSGTPVKLGFKQPYHHLYARALAKHEHEYTLLCQFKHAAAAVGAGDYIVDFGGYNGMYGLLAAAVNPQATVIIVEADPTNVEEIKANIELNQYQNVSVSPVAIAGESGTLKFRLHQSGTAGKCDENGEYAVTAVTLAEVLKGSTPVTALLKFDVLGAEYDALLKAKTILEKIPQLRILLEFYPVLPEAETKFWEYCQALGLQSIYLYPRSDGGSTFYWLTKG